MAPAVAPLMAPELVAADEDRQTANRCSRRYLPCLLVVVRASAESPIGVSVRDTPKPGATPPFRAVPDPKVRLGSLPAWGWWVVISRRASHRQVIGPPPLRLSIKGDGQRHTDAVRALEDGVACGRSPSLVVALIAPRFVGEDSGGRRSQLVISAPSNDDLSTVLGGVKGSLAALGGCAALDPASAPCDLPLSTAPGSTARFSGVGRGPTHATARLLTEIAPVVFESGIFALKGGDGD